jgi:hypothetical protein
MLCGTYDRLFGQKKLGSSIMITHPPMWNVTTRLITIPKDAFQKCFQQWQKRWKKCVHYQGDFFEGD